MNYLLLLLELFGRFFYVGLFSIGGGLATLPFLQNLGEVTGWFSPMDISNMVAVSESTPGPMGINMATYVGYVSAGIPGAILAPLGEIAPAIIIITIISKILIKFKNSKKVDYAFYGLRAASIGLICAACFAVAKIALFNAEAFEAGAGILGSFEYKAIALTVIIFVLNKVFKKVHPVIWIVIAAAAGILLKM